MSFYTSEQLSKWNHQSGFDEVIEFMVIMTVNGFHGIFDR